MKGMILYYSKNKGNWERTLVAITYFYNIYHRSSVPYFFCLLQKRERLFRVYCKAYYFSHKFQVNLQLRDLKYDRKIHDFEIKKKIFFQGGCHASFPGITELPNTAYKGEEHFILIKSELDRQNTYLPTHVCISKCMKIVSLWLIQNMSHSDSLVPALNTTHFFHFKSFLQLPVVVTGSCSPRENTVKYFREYILKILKIFIKNIKIWAWSSGDEDGYGYKECVFVTSFSISQDSENKTKFLIEVLQRGRSF